MNNAIPQDALDGGLSIDSAVDILLGLQDSQNEISKDEKEDNEEVNEVEATEDSQEDEEQTLEDSEDGDQEEIIEESEDTEEAPPEKLLSDNEVVEVKIGDKNEKVSVKELKRLYGQEKALTQKSMQVAEAKKAVEADSLRHRTALEVLQKRAADKYAPFAEIDWVVEAQVRDVETLKVMREMAKEAEEEYRFINQEVDRYIQSTQEKQRESVMAQVQETNKILSEKLPGWGQEMYKTLTDYAAKAGMPAELINGLVDPTAFILIHKAMRYDQAKKLSAKTKPKSPSKVMKAGTTTPTEVKSDVVGAKIKRLQQTGSRDDAVEAYLAMLGHQQ